MASRAELVQMAMELKIDWINLSINELTEAIRKEADRLFSNKKVHISANGLSDTLKRFLVYEYDFVIRTKNGKEKI